MIVIGRPINGISLNGLEYLLDENNEYKTFEDTESAKGFLRENGYESFTDDELEDSFIFKDESELYEQ